MKIIKWTDADGWNHESLVREIDNPQDAIQGRGVKRDPPDIKRLDWEQIKRDLHNILLAKGVVSYADIQQKQTGLNQAVASAIVPKLLELYKEDGGKNE
jgi:hypothetical protein